jgi:hypothetical protein
MHDTSLFSKKTIKTKGILGTTSFAGGIFDLVLLAIELSHSYIAHLYL